ncbi:MAG: hypothetical protein LCH79_15245 [Proteobacteria bacterium]|nr:hypothetical protein [Pseudomonadota bacterium]
MMLLRPVLEPVLRPVLGGNLIGGPSLWLNFLSGTLDPRITAAGGVNGTRVNSAGLIEAATCPRFDYDPVTLAARGVLIEEQRTNELLYGVTPVYPGFDWTTDGLATLTSTPGVLGPSGAPMGFLAKAGGGTYVYQGGHSTTDGVAKTYSIFFRAGDSANPILSFGFYQAAAATVASASVNTATGAITASTGTASVVAWGGGLFQLLLTGTPTITATTAYVDAVLGGGVTDGTGHYIGCASLAQGPFPTSYIPTGAAAVTRTPDSLTMTGTDFSDWWNQAEGTIVVKFDCFGVKPDDGFIFSATDASEAEQIRLLVYAGVVYLQVSAGGVNVVNMNLGAIDTGSHTLAVAYKANDFAACLDGGAVATDTSGAVPAVDRAGFGRYAASNFGHLNGHLQVFGYWPRRIPDFQLQAQTN